MAKKTRLRLHRRTLRDLSHRELGIVRGGADDIQQVTRAYTGCEYCGNTNADPNPCKESHACPEPQTNPPPSADFICTITDSIVQTICVSKIC